MEYTRSELGAMFARIYMGIRSRGAPVDLVPGGNGKIEKLRSCFEYDAMVALKTMDGKRELGVLRDGIIITGMFPRMSCNYRLESIPRKRIGYFSRNLEFYQARLKL